jgi:hypothetical protein
MGPMTTPAIQVLLFDGGLGVDGCSVGRGVLEVEEEELEIRVEAVATLENVGTADVEPVYVLSIDILGFDSLKTYCSTGLKLCWTPLQVH